MVKKEYDWENGAVLLDHTRRKHDIIRSYFYQYLKTRSISPLIGGLRLAVVDGFSGGGLYEGGEPGSPLIILEVLKQAVSEVNIERSAKGYKPFIVVCDLILNDLNKTAIRLLQERCAPLLGAIKAECEHLDVTTTYLSKKFEDAKGEILQLIRSKNYHNAFFLLDQCGHSKIYMQSISELMNAVKSPEILLTFSINAIKSFLSPDDAKNRVALNGFDLTAEIDNLINQEEKGLISKDQWLGYAELALAKTFRRFARYVAPFSIKNPSGYHYWLIHFSQQFTARRVYNDVLHDKHNYQAHYGKSGLNMLGYDPSFEGQLYSFTGRDRARDRDQLHNDIPEYLRQYGGGIEVSTFLEQTYNDMVSHSSDPPLVMIENDDLEVITPKGRPRQTPGTIKGDDILRLKTQPLFFPSFGISKKK